MAGLVVQGMANLSVSSSCSLRTASRPGPQLGFCCSSLRGNALLTASRQHTVSARGMFQPVEAKQNALKRIKVAEKARQYNKSRKSAIATRMKKVFTAITALKATSPESEDAVKPVEKLISEAYQEIDKAVVKGVLHKNTGDRRKSRLAKAKRDMLVGAGLYKPATA